jgi:beta-N-acetylhexosaminidase
LLNSDFSLGSQNALASIFSISGMTLTDAEKGLFKSADPFGIILFKRNCDNPKQLRTLIDDLKNTVGRNCPVLIDQEGGRVQRLRPPHWRDYKPMKYYGDLYAENPEAALEELRFETLRMAEELAEVGINVDCAPVMDLAFPWTTDAIGDRAFSSDPAIVARLALSVCRHLLKSGITPVIKHIPGHGRAKSDSHLELPRVETSLDELLKTDFCTFKSHNHESASRATWGMTAHIVYPSIDTDHPVSVSKKGVDLIRNTIGFKGLLLSDDLDMKALDRYGDVSAKALATLQAGCDVALYCAGDLKVMEKLAENLPKLGKTALQALQNATKEAKLTV